jgi:ribosome biogenesis protein UTP30
MEIQKSKKDKIEEGKKKKSMKGGDDGKVLADERQEDKKSKGEKSDNRVRR